MLIPVQITCSSLPSFGYWTTPSGWFVLPHPGSIETLTFLLNSLSVLDLCRSISYRGPHPAHPGGLGGPRAELVESQRGRAAGEKVVLEKPPALEAVGSQALVVLAQKLDGLVVLTKTFVAVPLAPQPVGHACGVDALLHLWGDLSGFCRTAVQCSGNNQPGLMFFSTATAAALAVSLMWDANGCETQL